MKKKVEITQSENREVVILSFIHSLNEYLLSICSVQDILLDTRDAMKKKTVSVHENVLSRDLNLVHIFVNLNAYFWRSISLYV